MNKNKNKTDGLVRSVIAAAAPDENMLSAIKRSIDAEILYSRNYSRPEKGRIRPAVRFDLDGIPFAEAYRRNAEIFERAFSVLGRQGSCMI